MPGGRGALTPWRPSLPPPQLAAADPVSQRNLGEKTDGKGRTVSPGYGKGGHAQLVNLQQSHKGGLGPRTCVAGSGRSTLAYLSQCSLMCKLPCVPLKQVHHVAPGPPTAISVPGSGDRALHCGTQGVRALTPLVSLQRGSGT